MAKLACAIALTPGLTHASAEQTPDPAVVQPADSKRVTAQFRGFLLGKSAVTVHVPREVSEVLGIAQVEGRLDIQERFVIAAALRLRSEGKLGPNTETEFELRETQFGYRSDVWQITLGRQQVVWGKADGLRLLDMVNPLDLREFVLDDYSRTRIPLWMVNGELFKGSSALQLLVIPDQRENRRSQVDGRFSQPLPLPLLESVTVNPVDRPSMRHPREWEYGIRWESRLGGVGYTANIFRTWTDEPIWFATSGPEAGVVQPRVVRQSFVGGSWDVPFGATVMRGEITVTPNGYARTELPNGLVSYSDYPQLDGVVGIDWMTGRWTVSPQVFHRRTFETAGLVDDHERTLLTLLIQVSVRQDRLTFKTFGVLGTNDGDRWITPSLIYDAGNGLELTLGADLFGGPAFSPVGRFRRQSRLVLQAQWWFDRGIDRTARGGR